MKTQGSSEEKKGLPFFKDSMHTLSRLCRTHNVKNHMGRSWILKRSRGGGGIYLME